MTMIYTYYILSTTCWRIIKDVVLLIVDLSLQQLYNRIQEPKERCLRGAFVASNRKDGAD